MEMLDDPAWQRGLPEAIVADVRRSLPAIPKLLEGLPMLVARDEAMYRRKFGQLLENGVEILPGTDTGNPGHFHPFGLWIAFDVVTGTALACGGYGVAILVYILNKGHYSPLVRPALLTSALGYSLAGLGVALDVGRWWALWKVPLYFWQWNFNSVLLEVALCIMAYTVVLWVELSPAILEQFRDSAILPLRRFARATLPILDKISVWVVALGMLLPTMHQSSLGTLMLLANSRLHPLWRTPWLPLLFLVTCSGRRGCRCCSS